VFKDGSVITPPLTGTILPGITRKSLMQLASDAGTAIEERPYAFDQWQADAASGHLVEAFACGTAAVVAGIGKVRHDGGEFLIGDGQTGPVTRRLREALVSLQRGQSNDPYGWVRTIG
jgi:branched-chain amino acid aminotransferase